MLSPRPLIAAALLLASSCMFATMEVNVRHRDGSRDTYEVDRRGDTLTKVEVEWRGEERITAARLIIFADRNRDGRPDADEILHDLRAPLERPAREVAWKRLSLSGAEQDGDFVARFELVGERRGPVSRNVEIIPGGLLRDWAD